MIEGAQMPAPQVFVQTTKNRGFTPEEIAERCVDRIISISDSADPVVREQAQAMRQNMISLVATYMKDAIQSDRTTIYNAVTDAGHPKLAEYLRRL